MRPTNSTHRPNHGMVRALIALTIGLVVTLVLSLQLPPAADAASALRLANDTTTVAPGASATINVLANDTVVSKATATVTMVGATPGLNVAVTRTNTVRIRVAANTNPGPYTLTYQVTDRNRRHATARISVTVTGDTLLKSRINALTVAAEHPTGYDRNLFKLWVDANKNGCDTRDEVLISEAVSHPTVGTNCALTDGLWYSYYDAISTTNPSTFDIDHLVPLAQAWASGAYKWDADTRMRYANDLDDPRALVAVSASANRSKGDRDPAQWMPPATNVACRYIVEWVAVKTRWSLTVDKTEKAALLNIITTHKCPNAAITVKKAHITLGTDPTDPTDPPITGVHLTSIAFDPEGDDTVGEYVTLTNGTAHTLNLNGWKLTDAAGHTYTFPTSAVSPAGNVTVKAPTGTDTTTGANVIFYAGWGAIFNNTGGDTATLTNNTGAVVDTCSYDDTAVRVATC